MSTARSIPSSYTIDGLLGLNRDDEHKQRTKPEQEQAPGHSTDKTARGTVKFTVLALKCLKTPQLFYISQKSWEVNRADSAFSDAKMLFLLLVVPSPC